MTGYSAEVNKVYDLRDNTRESIDHISIKVIMERQTKQVLLISSLFMSYVKETRLVLVLQRERKLEYRRCSILFFCS